MEGDEEFVLMSSIETVLRQSGDGPDEDQRPCEEDMLPHDANSHPFSLVPSSLLGDTSLQTLLLVQPQ